MAITRTGTKQIVAAAVAAAVLFVDGIWQAVLWMVDRIGQVLVVHDLAAGRHQMTANLVDLLAKSPRYGPLVVALAVVVVCGLLLWQAKSPPAARIAETPATGGAGGAGGAGGSGAGGGGGGGGAVRIVIQDLDDTLPIEQQRKTLALRLKEKTDALEVAERTMSADYALLQERLAALQRAHDHLLALRPPSHGVTVAGNQISNVGGDGVRIVGLGSHPPEKKGD
jgi:hypothetical protein